MKAVIQRVAHASVIVDEQVIGAIDQGFLVLLGVGTEDTKEDVDRIVKKMAGLRIFADAEGKTNLSLKDVGGSVAEELYEYFVETCRSYIPHVETGSFGAHMQVKLLNDGPFTIILE